VNTSARFSRENLEIGHSSRLSNRVCSRAKDLRVSAPQSWTLRQRKATGLLWANDDRSRSGSRVYGSIRHGNRQDLTAT
jgi:hypothetical protein